MDDVFGKVDGKFKISFLTDSTMMWIVHCAMDRAHERAQSKEGVIERLTEISKFYELAVMQLEGCLRFVQEETDNMFESSDEEVLGDLTEIRDRLVRRLNELEMAIAEKDRETVERLENELKLRQALEMKERQLDALRAKLNLESSVEEHISSNKVSIDDLILGNQVNAGEEFSGLKHSVDQQVWNIKHKLEPESKSIDTRRNMSCDSLKIEQMRLDIDILKETMDVAFGKMQSVIFSMEPPEQQWRLMIEKEALGILIKGFVGDIQESFKAQVKEREKQVSFGLSEHLSGLMTEIKHLNDELEALCLSQSNLEDKISLQPRERSSSEGKNYGNSKISTLKFEKVDQKKELSEEDTDNDGHTFVAKMIKNHESIIKRKNKELNWLKRENLGEKECSYSRRGEDLVSSRKRIRDVIARVENLINWNSKLSENFKDYEGHGGEKNSSTKRFCKLHNLQQKLSHVDDLEGPQKNVNKISGSDAENKGLCNDLRILKEEKENESFQTTIMEKIYATFLECFIYESNNELHRYDMEILIREGKHEDLLKKMINEWNAQMESEKINIQIREEIHCIVFNEAIKDVSSSIDSALVECLDTRVKCSYLEDNNLEGKVREEISRVLFGEIYRKWNEFIERSDAENLVREEICQIAFKETLRDVANTADHIISIFKEGNLEGKMREEISRLLFGDLCKEWNEVIERLDTENLIREEIYQVVFEESFRDIASTGNGLLSKLNEVKVLENCIYGFHCDESFQCIEHSIEENVYMVFLREMCKEWKEEINDHKLENLQREEVFRLALVKAVEGADIANGEETRDHFKFSEDVISADKLSRSQEIISEEKILFQKQESLLNCIQVEEDLIQSTSSEIKNHSANHHPIQGKHEKLDKRKISQELLTEMGSTCISVSTKVENALEQLAVSKALLDELRSCLVVGVEDIERFDDQTVSVASACGMKVPWLQPREIKVVKLTPSYSSFTPFIEFSQVFMDFKCRVEEKLALNILRLEEAMHYLNPLAELVAQQRGKELLYRKAFISRSENLRKAETEVDLLGDQVEVLLGLLEKIYNILHHYSPVLEQYFEVSDILRIIRKEVIGEVLACSDT